MTRRKLAWMVATKVAFTIAVMLPLTPRGAVEYRAMSALSGVRAGTPVILFGQRIGEVVAKNRRGDTTFLTVRFKRDAERLPGSRVVQSRWMGFGQEIALEIQPAPRRVEGPFARGGWLRVIPSDPSPYLQPEILRPRDAPPGHSPFPQLMPLVPIAPPRWAPVST
jgi:hypothetical protein